MLKLIWKVSRNLFVFSFVLGAAGAAYFFSPYWKPEYGERLTEVRDSATKTIVAQIQSRFKADDAKVTLLPPHGQTWVFGFERALKLTSKNSPWFDLSLKGKFSISRNPDMPMSAFITLSVSEGIPKGALPEVLPSFRLQLSRDEKIEKVSVIGRIMPELQENWEDLGKDLISHYFILDSKSRLGAYASESKWTGNTLFERTIFSYSEHPELKIKGSNHVAYFDEKGLALVEGSEDISISSGEFDQASSYRIERRAVLQQVLAVRVGNDEKTLAWGEEKKLYSGSTFAENRNPASIPRPKLHDFRKWSPIERVRSLSQIVKRMDLDGAETARLVQEFLKSHSDAKAWAFGTGAMASSTNPEAQKVLVELLESKDTTQEQRDMILSALTAAAQPLTADTEDAILKIVKAGKSDLKEGALYALGSAIRASTDVTQRSRFETELLDQARRSKGARQDLVFLDAIGNSGSSALLPFVAEKLKSASDAVRMKAVYSTRYMKADVSAAVLGEAENDASAKVRRMIQLTREFQKRLNASQSEEEGG